MPGPLCRTRHLIQALQLCAAGTFLPHFTDDRLREGKPPPPPEAAQWQEDGAGIRAQAVGPQSLPVSHHPFLSPLELGICSVLWTWEWVLGKHPKIAQASDL